MTNESKLTFEQLTAEIEAAGKELLDALTEAGYQMGLKVLPVLKRAKDEGMRVEWIEVAMGNMMGTADGEQVMASAMDRAAKELGIDPKDL